MNVSLISHLEDIRRRGIRQEVFVECISIILSTLLNRTEERLVLSRNGEEDMAMDGKDFAVLGALGALGYVLYEWYKQQGTLAGLLPCSTNAIGQSNASMYPGGVYNDPYYNGYGPIPTTIVIQPSTSTPAPSSTPVIPGQTPSPNVPQLPVETIGGAPIETIRLPHMVANPLVGTFTGLGDLSTGQLAAFRSLVNLPQYRQAYHRYTLMGLGSITPSMGFGVRRTGNIFPLGSEKRIVY